MKISVITAVRNGRATLPDEAVRIGSTWTELVEVPVSVDEGRLQQRCAEPAVAVLPREDAPQPEGGLVDLVVDRCDLSLPALPGQIGHQVHVYVPIPGVAERRAQLFRQRAAIAQNLAWFDAKIATAAPSHLLTPNPAHTTRHRQQ